jgi:uncharacterized protein Yka (UPF0111/DUF47 family)
MKTSILAAIGETGLQPANVANTGLAANDRVKYIFSLLQMALSHADHPDQPVSTLKQERIACGIDEPDFDGAVAGARMAGTSCFVPGAALMFARIRQDIHLMAPGVTSGPDGLAARIDRLLKALPVIQDDLIDPVTTSAMMRAGHGDADTLHRLVMDLHKRLNAMQRDLARETLDGASVYGLEAADRPLVSAFMAGVNQTAKLKFNHPGLATTATHADGRLVIQNDIGTTDAHVIVIHVKDFAVSLTYTDVHPERLAFFQGMLKPHRWTWDGQRTQELTQGAAFVMATGRLGAADAAECQASLEYLGSRLVFLIDWNHARKQLRGFLRGPDRLSLLYWAAASGIGHRGFLELGGARLINRAIEATSGPSMRFGDRLCDVLGDAATQAVLRVIFQTATEGLLAGASRTLIHDKIRMILAAHFSNEEAQLLRLAADHAGLIFELASLVRDGAGRDRDGTGKRARRARAFEHDADQLVVATREAVRRRPDFAVFLTLLEAADDAADALEDAAFLLDQNTLRGAPLASLQTLADLLAEASREWIKAVECAAQIGHADSAEDTGDFLVAIDRIAALEHDTDGAERALTANAIQHAKDFRELHLFTAIGGRLEESADALRKASLILRDQVLDDVIDG